LKHAPSSSVKELRYSVKQMHEYAHGYLHVAAIARLALAQLERPCGSCEYEDIAQALVMIERRAMEGWEDCDIRAESVGCQYIDNATRLRVEATLGVDMPFHRELMDNGDERAV